MTRRAFTLVEIMVTIAIIALLAAILIPALSYATGRAEDAVCRSHLHELAHCFHLYAASNRGYAPDEDSWHEQLHPYAPDLRVFACPGDMNPSDAAMGLSYSWRNASEADPLPGIRRMNGARDNAVLLFDFKSGWHHWNSLNVSLVDTSAHSYTFPQFRNDMDHAAQ